MRLIDHTQSVVLRRGLFHVHYRRHVAEGRCPCDNHSAEVDDNLVREGARIAGAGDVLVRAAFGATQDGSVMLKLVARGKGGSAAAAEAVHAVIQEG